MKNILFTIILAFMATTVFAHNNDSCEDCIVNYQNNRYPLITKPYMELPIGSIQPTGWLEEQLNRMAKGMTGHMDTIYEKVMGSRNDG